MFCRFIDGEEEDFQQKVDDAFTEAYLEFDKDKKENYCILMYHDAINDTSIIRINDKQELCKYLYSVLTSVYGKYKLGHENSIVINAYKNNKDKNILLFDINGLKFYFGTKDYTSLLVIRGILAMCGDENDLKKFLEGVDDDDAMIDCYNTLYINQLIKTGGEKKVVKEEIPKEKVVKEEIPREKTLSKKEKEKLKKQKAKEANKLREQEKKDKAKLAEQQAKQFEKQQKERERKRIETARKKKLALLKK
jgi:hypothetical protein